MSLITYSELRSRSKILTESKMESTASHSIEYKNIFLSHSSKDKEFLSGVINLLEEYGGQIYLDKGDKRLPRTTSHKTAEILKDTIKKLDKFILFTTENSKDSKWIPWELGIADGAKKYYDIALLPSSETKHESDWIEQEYLGIYKKIVWGKIKGGQEDWIVKDFHLNQASYLKDWLS